jgi:hypothetical protein
MAKKARTIMRTHTRNTFAIALAGALALSTMNVPPAAAASGSVADGNKGAVTTTFSARHYYRHGRYRRGNPAVLGAVAGIFGMIAGLAARDRYYDDYYDYGGPYYYYGGPYPSYGYSVPYRYHPHYRLGYRGFHGYHAFNGSGGHAHFRR